MSEQVLEAELIAVDGEPATLADLAPTPLQHPPAVRQVCACGKNGTPEAHGAIPDPRDPARTLRPMTCAEVLAIEARVNADLARRPSLLERLFGGAR